MSYSKSLLLFDDKPEYGPFLKLIFTAMPAGLLIASVFLWSTGEVAGGLTLLAESLFIGLIFWAVFPRKYQVYEDHLRITLGGPVAIKIGFEKIEAIRVTNKIKFSMNFVTRFTRTYVEIARKRGPSIAITPKNNDLFVENANQALNQWIKMTVK